ncbi:hypothetical protein [Streptomyces sp. NPDC059909]|uniref:hypothetical protein n=1 Tax=Streptomyces sp. NPDC059909 TaxID=3346998 RepID=UPI00365A8F85
MFGGTEITAEALAEADRLGALAETARFRLQLVSDQPEPLADTAFAHIDALRDAVDLAELKAGEAEFACSGGSYEAASRPPVPG